MENLYRLTPREIEILNEASNGKTYKEIGCYDTVKNMACVMLKKMKANSITQAVAMAIRAGII